MLTPEQKEARRKYQRGLGLRRLRLLTTPELRKIVARLRILMPRDPDVMAVCNALRGVLDLQPRNKDDRRVAKFEKAARVAHRREYQRQFMAAKRARERRENAPVNI